MLLLLAIPEAVQIAIVTAIVTLGTAWIAYLTTKINTLTKSSDAIHTLVNSQYGAQLKIAAVALRTIANRSGNVEEIKAAELAEQLLQDHETKQAVVDNKD